MIKNVSTILRYVEVRESVAIVVANRNPLSIAASGHVCLFRHISKRSIAVIAKERIAQWWGGIKEVALSAVHEINIHPTIVVVIEECATRACGFR